MVLHDADLPASSERASVEANAPHTCSHARTHFLTNAFDHAADGMLMIDHGGTILAANPAFTSMTGFRESEVIGHSCHFLRADIDGRRAFSAFWAELLKNGHWRGRVRCRRKSDIAFPDWQSYTVIPGDDGAPPRILLVCSGVSALSFQEIQIDLLACHDPLTGLPNRAQLFERLRQTLHNRGEEPAPVAVFSIDLDLFKLVNDSLGHEVGDRMLVQVSRRLKGAIGSTGTIARMGGDEFAVVLTEFDGLSELSSVAENLLAQLLEPIYLDGHTVHVTASIGISVFPHGGGDARALVQNAEAAMYRVKERGRNAYEVFDPSWQSRTVARLDLQADLRRAAESQEFVLHFQPKVALGDRAIQGCEALIRWQHPTAGMISPAEFIPLAEETGLILPIGLWALRSACEHRREWYRDGLDDFSVAINLSARQFRQSDLVDQIRNVIADTDMSPEHLEIELTESTVMDDAEQAIRVMKRLRDMGVRISVDDFGTGYSSLSYLRKLPLNSLKIDRSFIADVMCDSDDAAIVHTIVSLARILRLDVVAEGIETEAQLNFLRNLGCPIGQGYFFSFPLPAEEFADWVREQSPPEHGRKFGTPALNRPMRIYHA